MRQTDSQANHPWQDTGIPDKSGDATEHNKFRLEPKNTVAMGEFIARAADALKLCLWLMKEVTAASGDRETSQVTVTGAFHRNGLT